MLETDAAKDRLGDAAYDKAKGILSEAHLYTPMVDMFAPGFWY